MATSSFLVPFTLIFFLLFLCFFPRTATFGLFATTGVFMTESAGMDASAVVSLAKVGFFPFLSFL